MSSCSTVSLMAAPSAAPSDRRAAILIPTDRSGARLGAAAVPAEPHRHLARLQELQLDRPAELARGRLDADGYLYITGRIKDILVLSNGEKVPPMDMELAISLVPAIEQVMVIGEGESFLSAIAVMGAEEWPALAGRFSLDSKDPASLQNEKLHNYLLKEIKKHLKDFPGYAKIRRVILTLEPWTVDNGLLTPTLKVKRARVMEAFADEIAALYASGSAKRS